MSNSLRVAKVTANDKPIFIAGILIALQNEDFENTYMNATSLKNLKWNFYPPSKITSGGGQKSVMYYNYGIFLFERVFNNSDTTDISHFFFSIFILNLCYIFYFLCELPYMMK